MTDDAAMLWGELAPNGVTSDAVADPVVGLVESPPEAIARRTRKMLEALPSDVYDRVYRESLQSDVFEAIAEALTLWSVELQRMKAESFIDTSTGSQLEVCGENYGVSRGNIGITDAAFRSLIKLCAFKPRGVMTTINEAVEILTGVTPVLSEPAPRTVRISIPISDAFQDGNGLGIYPSADITDTDATGRGRGYVSGDLGVSDDTGIDYVFGPTLGRAEMLILRKLTLAGTQLEVVIL